MSGGHEIKGLIRRFPPHKKAGRGRIRVEEFERRIRHLRGKVSRESDGATDDSEQRGDNNRFHWQEAR
jgi:hypothetical protein